jgi:translocation and assembly module TamB
MTSTVRGRARGRWVKAAVGFLVVIAGLIAILPWLLRLPGVQRRMALEANKILAPSAIEFGEIRLSWFRSTEITNIVLHDAHGDKLVAAPKATFGWNLWQILVTRPQTVNLTIQHGDLDIERSADGTVDLYETLRPVISEYPQVRLKIWIENGRLRYRDPLFSDPVVADQARFVLDLGRLSEPITWDIQLANAQKAGDPARLGIVGKFSRAQLDSAGRHDLELAIKGMRWPWTLANSLVQTRGELTGTINGEMVSARVRINGDATVTNLVAIGDLFASDTVHLEKVVARLSLEGYNGSWSIDKLDLTSPVATLRGEGSIPPTAAKGAWLEATTDLAALAKQLPATLHLRDDLRVERGAARLRADVRLNADGHTDDWDVNGNISELAARVGVKALTLPEPATLVAKLKRDKLETTLERLDVRSSFLKATGQGDLDKGITMTATLDLAAFRERFRDWIDLGKVELAGQGTIDGLYQRQGQEYRASASASFRDLRLVGLPVLEKIQRDQLTIDGKMSGRATSSGWPLSWNELSVRGLSGETELTVSAKAGLASGELTLAARASSPLPLDGRPHRVVAELGAKSSPQGDWTADRLGLAVFRASKWGPGIGPDEAIRWEGKGHYDSRRDQLLIESIANHLRPAAENETWIKGNQSLRASGLKSLGAAQAELAANGGLKSLGQWLAPGDSPWGGEYEALVRARRDRDAWDLGARLELRDPERAAGDLPKMGLSGDVSLAANAVYTTHSDLLEMTELTLKAPNLQVEGAGKVRRLTSRADIDLKGSLDLDWAAIQTTLASKVEPNARIAGRPRGWRLAGVLDSVPSFDHMGSLEGEVGVQIDALDVFGMRLTDVPVVLRSAAGRVAIDPIDGKLNGGVLHLEPELVRGKDGSTWLHLGADSRLDGAVVNDEVSHRVLSFAAPVLDGATRVEGRVSVVLADAYFPVATPSGAEVRIQGDVLFDNVRFMPGPLAEQLLGVFQRERRPLAVVRDPITVRIAGRKVYQQGLAVPVANVASIGLDGSVDFDQNLDLVARFALIPPRSNVPILTPLMANARFDLPIRGTLKNPKVDGAALKEYWKTVGTNLLGNSMDAGVNGLQKLLEGLSVPGLRRLIPPGRRAGPPPPPRPPVPDDGSDPVAGDRSAPDGEHEVLKPPSPGAQRSQPLTSAERKRIREVRRQERLQKKADRRAKQGPGPGPG